MSSTQPWNMIDPTLSAWLTQAPTQMDLSSSSLLYPLWVTANVFTQRSHFSVRNTLVKQGWHHWYSQYGHGHTNFCLIFALFAMSPDNTKYLRHKGASVHGSFSHEFPFPCSRGWTTSIQYLAEWPREWMWHRWSVRSRLTPRLTNLTRMSRLWISL